MWILLLAVVSASLPVGTLSARIKELSAQKEAEETAGKGEALEPQGQEALGSGR